LLAFAVRRLGAALLTVLAVATITFVLAHAAPGEPMLGDAERLHTDPGLVGRQRAQFGLDRPIAAQYAAYLANVARGRLGESFIQHRPVARLVGERLPNTVLLGGTALLLSFLLGITIALVQAARAGSWTDAALGAASLVCYSMPSFWLGLVLLYLFGQVLGWLPVGGMTTPVLHDGMGSLARGLDVARHLVLPAGTLALVQTAAVARYQRGALVDVLATEFVRAARAKGLGTRNVMVRHVLRSALAPVVTLAGIALPALLAGSVLVESVFGWPGMGRLTYDAIVARDYNVITGTALLGGTLVALGSLAADLAAHALDPRLPR
jgi:peptide/nickel transport system permease protein